VQDVLIALVIFGLLAGAGLGALFLHARVASHYRSDETANVVRQVASLFVMATSLVLGLMLNSARTTFDTTDHNIHVMATNLILFDRALAHYGPEMAETRGHLRSYVDRATHGKKPTDTSLADRTSESLLDAIGTSLARVRSQDPIHADTLRDIGMQYQAIVQLRWVILEQSDGSLPMPLIGLVTAWLIFIFASFGYRAPTNAVVGGTLVLAAALMGCSIYLILTLDRPFEGLIQVSPEPLERAIAEMGR
jgi:hypothetical protein